MPREAVRLTVEATYGVFNPAATPVKNTDYIVAELVQDDPLTVRKKPRIWGPLRSMDSFNRRVKSGSAQYGVDGSLMTLFYPEHGPFLANLLTLTGTNLNRLPSFSLDYLILMEDASETILYQRFLGCVLAQARFGAKAGGEDINFKLNLDVVAQQAATITGTDFPAPPASDYPVGNPYNLTHLATPGYLRLAATSGSRVEIGGLEVTVKNILDPTFFEQPYVTRIKWCGRDLDWTDTLAFVTNADRAAFEAQSALACSARIDDGTHHVIFAANAYNKVAEVTDRLSLDKLFLQDHTWNNFWDRTAGSGAGADFSITAT
jgi:hypothetical protein